MMQNVFSIFGWLAALIFLFYASMGLAMAALNNLGQFNIGGAPNSFMTKAITFLFIAVDFYMWYLLFVYAPFTISLNLAK